MTQQDHYHTREPWRHCGHMGIRGKWGIINLPIVTFTFVLQQYELSLVPRSISPPVFNTFDVAVPSVSMCQISLGPFHIILSHKWNTRFSLNCVFFTTTLNPITKCSTSIKLIMTLTHGVIFNIDHCIHSSHTCLFHFTCWHTSW